MDGTLTIKAATPDARADGLTLPAPIEVPEPRRVVLQDHARLPGRFFGRLRASIQAQAGL